MKLDYSNNKMIRVFNVSYAYANTYYPKAFYAQSRGVFRRWRHFGGNFGNIGRSYAFGRGSMNY